MSKTQQNPAGTVAFCDCARGIDNATTNDNTMTYDTVTMFHGSKIQYGRRNDRIYLMKLGTSTVSELLPALDSLAEEHRFGKIFAKIPIDREEAFLEAGYRRGSDRSRFLSRQVGRCFSGKYFQTQRAIAENGPALENVLALARGKEKNDNPPELPDRFEFRIARPQQAEAISEIYQEVFASYPFPIHDPAYIRKTMEEDVIYFSIWHDGRMVAISSAEMDRENGNVEMTDFATLPRWRGHRFGVFLLAQMEREMKKLGIPTAYTIARAVSPGMNITFTRLGYHFGGQLINNTQISGGLESMNVWYKSLS